MVKRSIAYGGLLLAAVYGLNIADRYICSLFMESIKSEYDMSDAMAGFVTGSASAILFAASSIPFGYAADRFNAKRLIVVALLTWSSFSILSGLSRALPSFVIARMGLGFAEAAAGPASQVFVAERYAPRDRGLVLAILSIGAPVGAAFGNFVGGAIAAELGWRSAMVAFGLLGFPLALLLLCNRQDRSGADVGPREAGKGTYAELLRLIATNPMLRHLVAGATVVSLWGWGLIWWTPSFLQRTFGYSLVETGELLGILHLAGGIAGCVAAGLAAMFIRDGSAVTTAKYLLISTVIGTLCSVVAYGADDASLSRLALLPFFAASYFFVAPTAALCLVSVDANLRGRLAAIVLLFSNLASLLVGPLAIGLASDLVAQSGIGAMRSLQVVVLLWTATGAWAAAHFALAMRHSLRAAKHGSVC